jgi:hypothetical protein
MYVYLQLADTAKRVVDGKFESDTWSFLSAAEAALVAVLVDTCDISKFYDTNIVDNH